VTFNVSWLLNVLAKFGLGTVIALAFTYWIITRVDPKIDRLDQTMQLHLQDMRNTTSVLSDIRSILTQMCADRRSEKHESIEGCFGDGLTRSNQP
jgi:hypothetical protein